MRHAVRAPGLQTDVSVLAGRQPAACKRSGVKSESTDTCKKERWDMRPTARPLASTRSNMAVLRCPQSATGRHPGHACCPEVAQPQAQAFAAPGMRFTGGPMPCNVSSSPNSPAARQALPAGQQCGMSVLLGVPCSLPMSAGANTQRTCSHAPAEPKRRALLAPPAHTPSHRGSG